MLGAFEMVCQFDSTCCEGTRRKVSQRKDHRWDLSQSKKKKEKKARQLPAEFGWWAVPSDDWIVLVFINHFLSMTGGKWCGVRFINHANTQCECGRFECDEIPDNEWRWFVHEKDTGNMLERVSRTVLWFWGKNKIKKKKWSATGLWPKKTVNQSSWRSNFFAAIENRSSEDDAIKLFFRKK